MTYRCVVCRHDIIDHAIGGQCLLCSCTTPDRAELYETVTPEPEPQPEAPRPSWRQRWMAGWSATRDLRR